jgi:hypothetical protein
LKGVLLLQPALKKLSGKKKEGSSNMQCFPVSAWGLEKRKAHVSGVGRDRLAEKQKEMDMV